MQRITRTFDLICTFIQIIFDLPKTLIVFPLQHTYRMIPIAVVHFCTARSLFSDTCCVTSQICCSIPTLHSKGAGNRMGSQRLSSYVPIKIVTSARVLKHPNIIWIRWWVLNPHYIVTIVSHHAFMFVGCLDPPFVSITPTYIVFIFLDILSYILRYTYQS